MAHDRHQHPAMKTPTEARIWRGPISRPSRRELLALLAILAVSGLVAAKFVAAGAPLGHDEAVYALKSRQMKLGGTSAWYWNDYRSPGLPLLLQLTWLVRGTEPFLRMSVWAFGSLGVILTWLIGRSLFDSRAGLLGAAGLSLASPWLASSTSIWPDVPGAVLGMAAITIVLFATDGDRVSWWALAAAPFAVAAVLVRYGALVPMGIGGLAILIWRWPMLRRGWPQLLSLASIIAAGSLLILMVPGVTGAATSPLSSINTLKAASDFPITQGIRDYIRQADFVAGGYVGLFLILGLVLAVLYAKKDPGLRASAVFVFSLTGATALVLVLILHGEYRYLAPVFPFAWILGGMGLAEASRRIPRETAMAVAVVLAILLPINALSHGDLEADKNDERFGDLRLVATAIDAEHGYEECGVITSYIPQVAWYSECVIRRFETVPVLTSPFFVEPQADYLLLVTGGKRQPQGESLDAYLGTTDEVFVESGNPEAGNLEYAVVYTLLGDS